MRFLSILVAAATFVASALAQSEAPLAFTTLPSSVTAGKPFQLKWAGGDGSPVTLILKKGQPENLQTVAVITGSAPGNSYTWTPSKDLINADDYALSISQGQDTINYTGQFSIVGGKDETATVVISGSSTFSFTPTTTTTSTNTSTSGSSSSGSNATTITTTLTSTSPGPALLTGTAPGASGTGASVTRNTTFSSATLSSTGIRSRSSTGTGSSGATGSATGSTTGSAAASTSTGAAPRVVALAQGAAFGGLGALVAFVAMF